MIATAAIQEYNGGIITVSYIISVIGAQTTLELLTRRTHIHGFYNWYDLNNHLVKLYSYTCLLGFCSPRQHLLWALLVFGECILLEIIACHC